MGRCRCFITGDRRIPIPTPVIGTARSVDCPALTAQLSAMRQR